MDEKCGRERLGVTEEVILSGKRTAFGQHFGEGYHATDEAICKKTKNLSGKKTKYLLEINMYYVFFCLEILGIVAFSISGALVAIKSKFDIFGVLVVGAITAVGGGITRDIIVGHNPPAIFNNVYLIGISALSSLLTFILAFVKRSKFSLIKGKIEIINNYFDAIGLAVFTIMGVESTFGYGYTDHAFLSIAMGVLTGVGGGLMRDIFTGSAPYIFTKHVYAISAILGATAFYYLRVLFAEIPVLATIVGVLLIFVLRLLATKFHWKLPKAHIEDDLPNHNN